VCMCVSENSSGLTERKRGLVINNATLYSMKVGIIVTKWECGTVELPPMTKTKNDGEIFMIS
jgi:hypothetical protein